jgi:type I restriction enzyme M protein
MNLLKDKGFSSGYSNILGLCKAANTKEIEACGWSLNPGRYVGTTAQEKAGDDFREQLEALQEDFERLTGDARVLEGIISRNVAELVVP